MGEFDEFGNAKENKEHFDYIFSYAPYNNIKKMDYPHIFITTSLSDNRVLFDEPAKFTAKLRDYKTCLLYTSPSPRDRTRSRMPSSA